MLIALLLIIMGGGGTALASTSAQYRYDTLTVKIYFHVNKTNIDRSYMHNGASLDDFVESYKSLQSNKDWKLTAFDVLSSASPEGYHRENINLAHGRAMAIIDYVERYVRLKGVEVNVSFLGNNWDKFRDAVAASELPEKQEVLNIIDREPEYVLVNNKDTDTRIIDLQALNSGVTYGYFREYIFPNLRASYARLVFRNEIPTAKIDTVIASTIVQIDTLKKQVVVEETPYSPDQGRKLVFAFRTNLLLPLLNVGFEVPIGNRWSIGFDHYYPWLWRYWPTQSNEYCFEMMWENLEIRYWFGKDHAPGEANYSRRLQGHSIGLFGQGGYYDVGRNWHGYQGEAGAVGVDYLYGMSFCKGAIHMEFYIGIGYLYSSYRQYEVFTSGGQLYRKIQGDGVVHWFGPVKAGISFVVPIYAKYYKTKRTVE